MDGCVYGDRGRLYVCTPCRYITYVCMYVFTVDFLTLIPPLFFFFPPLLFFACLYLSLFMFQTLSSTVLSLVSLSNSLFTHTRLLHCHSVFFPTRCIRRICVVLKSVHQTFPSLFSLSNSLPTQASTVLFHLIYNQLSSFFLPSPAHFPSLTCRHHGKQTFIN